MLNLIESQTPRLLLRQWQASDFAPFAQLCADPRVMEFFVKTLSPTESEALAKKMQQLIAQRGWGLWAVRRKDTGDFIGFVGLHIPADPLPFSPCVEVGWRLAHAHWGQGFATEAARAALRVGFEQLGLNEIVSFTALNNLRSRAVMQRLGMRADEKTFEHPAVPVGHALCEHCLYRLGQEEFCRLS